VGVHYDGETFILIVLAEKGYGSMARKYELSVVCSKKKERDDLLLHWFCRQLDGLESQ
jgi:hypothetical protein